MFRTVPLYIISSFSLYTEQWYMSYRFADSLQAGSGRSSVLILLAGCMTYTIAVCTVKNSRWWTEELSDTCRFLFQNKILEINASSLFYYENLTLLFHLYPGLARGSFLHISPNVLLLFPSHVTLSANLISLYFVIIKVLGDANKIVVRLNFDWSF